MNQILIKLKTNSAYWVVGGAYLLGFIWSRIDGIRFDASTRGFYWQFLASDHMLGETPAALWYMHIQPVGFNFLLAVTDFFYPENQAVLFEAFYFGLGLLLVWMVTWLVAHWTRNIWVGLASGLFVAVLPSTYIYGAWLHYTYLIALLVLAVVFLVTVATAWERPWMATIALVPLLGLFLVRSNFAWVFVIFFGGFVVWWSLKLGANRKLIVILSALVLIVLGLFTVRNLVIFGISTQSSWGGNMLASQIWVELSSEQKAELALKHPQFKDLLETRSPFSELTPSDIASTQAELPDGLPASYSEPFKPNERINWNFAGFLPLSKEWQSFALVAIREYPGPYVRGVARSTVNYFSNQACYNWVDENASEVMVWRTVTSNLLLLGGTGEECSGPASKSFVLTPWLFFAASFIAIPFAWRQSYKIVVTYIFGVTMMLAAVATTNLVAYVEAQRMRMEVDFLLIATGFAGLAIITQALLARSKQHA